jgi:integrase
MAPTSIRRIHGILSPALGYAVAWGWIERNPAEFAHPPKIGRSKARPPLPDDVARLLNRAQETDPELFLFLWLAAISGARRGELVALRWTSFSESQRTLVFEDNYVQAGGKCELKNPKTDEDRDISIDQITIELLKEFRTARQVALAPAHLTLPPAAFIFSPDPVGERPWHPDHFTHAYRALATSLSIDKPLKNLRHYNATQLLAAGVDLRTVAGRLGHSGGGATTLRVYAARTKPADQEAAEIMAAGLGELRREAELRAGLAGDSGAGGGDQGEGTRPRPLSRVPKPVGEVLPAPVAIGTFRDIAEQLRAAVDAGRLVSGDQVPTVEQLAAVFSVVKSTAQRAVKLLGEEGVVVRSGARWVVV